MDAPVETVSGIVRAGHGVASGRAGDPRFPAGTIAMQIPAFRARGIDLAALIGAEPHPGTINLDVSPAMPTVVAPDVTLRAVAWSPDMPPEDFWLFHAVLEHRGASHRALIYMPDPATKPEHFQPTGVIEIIAARISGLAVGDAAGLTARGDGIGFVVR